MCGLARQATEGCIETRNIVRAVTTCRGQKTDFRTTHIRDRQHVSVQCQIVGFHRKPATTHRNDLSLSQHIDKVIRPRAANRNSHHRTSAPQIGWKGRIVIWPAPACRRTGAAAKRRDLRFLVTHGNRTRPPSKIVISTEVERSAVRTHPWKPDPAPSRIVIPTGAVAKWRDLLFLVTHGNRTRPPSKIVISTGAVAKWRDLRFVLTLGNRTRPPAELSSRPER